MSYSLTVQAEVYFRGLVGDTGRGGDGTGPKRNVRGEGEGGRPGTSGRGSAEERRGTGGGEGRGGLRLVSSEESYGEMGGGGDGV